MNNQSFQEIKADQEYSDGFNAGRKSVLKSLKKMEDIKNAAEQFIDEYESTFGAPDDWEAFTKLRKLLTKL